jgi:hypothetical protein
MRNVPGLAVRLKDESPSGSTFAQFDERVEPENSSVKQMPDDGGEEVTVNVAGMKYPEPPPTGASVKYTV